MKEFKFGAKVQLSEAVHYGFEYQLLDEGLEPLGPPVQCKDFLTDAFWSEYLEKPISIYSFAWKPGRLEIDKPWYYLGIRYNGQDLKEWVEPITLFMNAIEKELDFNQTKVYTANEGKALVVKFSGEWTKKPILISTYTQLLRLAVKYDGKTPALQFLKTKAKSGTVLCSVDTSRIGQFSDNLQAIVEKGWPKQTYEEYKDVHKVHGYGGLIGYFQWIKLSKRDKELE